MPNKLLYRFVLLLALGAIVMSASDGAESSEKGSASKESSEEDSKDTGKADTEELEQLILGTFKLTSDPKAQDFQDFLKAMEYTKPTRNMIKSVKDLELKIKKIKKSKYEIMCSVGRMVVKTTKFTIGKEFNDKLIDSRKYKATVTFEGENKMTRDEKHASGFTCHNVMEFTQKGFTLNLECKGVHATQEYTRK